MTPIDLIETARDLLRSASGRPKQAVLRRTVSTTYYAMFHALCRCCADSLVGSTKRHRSEQAWHQTYRALEHGYARGRCERVALERDFSSAVEDFANVFVVMQHRRHDADYNLETRFDKTSVLNEIADVEQTLHAFQSAPLSDRRAFSVFVLLKKR